MIYVNSKTILNNDPIFYPYILESYPHLKKKSFNNYLPASIFFSLRSIPFKNIPCIHSFSHIIQTAIIPVRNNSMRSSLKFIQMINLFTSKNT